VLKSTPVAQGPPTPQRNRRFATGCARSASSTRPRTRA
jgi:hypothetical protein